MTDTDDQGGFVLPAKDAPRGGGEKKFYPVIPDGQIVPVEVVQIAEKSIPVAWRKSDGPETEISFHFKVNEGQFNKSHIWGRTMPYFNWGERCRFRLWIQAILGVEELPEGFRLEPTAEQDKQGNDIKVFHAFDGMDAKVLVKNYTTKKTAELKHVVEDVLPSIDYVNPFQAPQGLDGVPSGLTPGAAQYSDEMPF